MPVRWKGLARESRIGEQRSHRDKVFQDKGFIMNMEVVWNFLSTQGADFGLKILGAIAAWVIGRWLISLAVRLIGAALEKGKKIDSTQIGRAHV
jgi:small conductance mechanosensitive channel